MVTIRRPLFIAVASLLIVAIGFIAFFLLGSANSNRTISVGVSADQLNKDLNNFLATKKGSYRITVRELDQEKRRVSIRGSEATDPASIMKLFYAWLALKQVDLGKVSLDSELVAGLTWNECLRVMIEISDNQCSIDIREALGNEYVNQEIRDAGFSSSFLSLYPGGEYRTKRTSTNDVTLLLAKLESGTMLSKSSTDYFHSLLLRQAWRSRIGSGVPAGVVVESKLGNLKLDVGIIEADSAIVRGPHSTYLLTVIGDGKARVKTVKQISTIVYKDLQGEPTSPLASYPKRQFLTTRGTALMTYPGGSVIANVPAGKRLELITSFRNFALVRVPGLGKGYLDYFDLKLVPEFEWSN
jgi:beta-lactamase class A